MFVVEDLPYKNSYGYSDHAIDHARDVALQAISYSVGITPVMELTWEGRVIPFHLESAHFFESVTKNYHVMYSFRFFGINLYIPANERAPTYCFKNRGELKKSMLLAVEAFLFYAHAQSREKLENGAIRFNAFGKVYTLDDFTKDNDANNQAKSFIVSKINAIQTADLLSSILIIIYFSTVAMAYLFMAAFSGYGEYNVFKIERMIPAFIGILVLGFIIKNYQANYTIQLEYYIYNKDKCIRSKYYNYFYKTRKYIALFVFILCFVSLPFDLFKIPALSAFIYIRGIAYFISLYMLIEAVIAYKAQRTYSSVERSL